MDAARRRLVRHRARDRCEYCLLPQFAIPAHFHLEHVIAKQHRGSDDLNNLALSCPYCNRHKGPNLTSIDPQTGHLISLFNPRVESWDEHFAFVGISISGLTAKGRATVELLQMNDDHRLEIRSILFEKGEMPGRHE